jgi:hypothetical protein
LFLAVYAEQLPFLSEEQIARLAGEEDEMEEVDPAVLAATEEILNHFADAKNQRDFADVVEKNQAGSAETNQETPAVAA